MDYILRSTRHKTMIAKGTMEDVYLEYTKRLERFPNERFEIINALGELVDVKDIASGHFAGSDTDVRESFSEDSDSELPEYHGYRTEQSTDSTD